MKDAAFIVLTLLTSLIPGRDASIAGETLRPPAVPLVACDPYFSIWSCADRLYEDDTRHWTGRAHALTSLIRIDGTTYRLMGRNPDNVPPLEQTRVTVWPTRTCYEFEGAGLQVSLTFMQAALAEDIDLLSRPVVYLTWECRSADGKPHTVSLYYDNTTELVVDRPEQAVVWSGGLREDLVVLEAASEKQPVLERKGDNVRIDWGTLYVTAPRRQSPVWSITRAQRTRTGFVRQGTLPAVMETNQPCPVREDAPVLALMFELGSVRTPVQRRVTLAYDDRFSIRYFGQPLRPYWRREGMDGWSLLQQAEADYAELHTRCKRFDRELMDDLRRSGGEKYALMAALAYRQCVAANKIVADPGGMPLMFSKENFSNGCMGTADVFYPMAPQFLLLNPGLMKATVVPLLEYAASERWPFPFSPHDLGTYPHADGQAYGGGERSEENQMPVEECGNMLLLMAAIAQAEGDARLSERYWPLLTQWAEYLRAKGLDPENQLCTDDFAGHLAHNVNLSIKAILGMASYGKLAGMLGKTETAASYRQLARTFAGQWAEMADDGDHYRLAFDKPRTWSQKYNLIWDRLLDLDIFPEAIAAKEMAHYRRIQNPYGLPLDNRTEYTKLDWIFWTASLTGRRDDFEALIDPVFAFLNATPDRVPMTDWYWTHNARVRGFQARPVVGGVFIRMLDDSDLWSKWARRAEPVTGRWAPLPKPPIIKTVIETARDRAVAWFYTTRKPEPEWMGEPFDDARWSRGPAGFGTEHTPGAVLGTNWNSSDIWLRREFVWEGDLDDTLHLLIHHDEDAEVYINGILAAETQGYTTDYEPVRLSKAARSALRPGKNLLAVHCHQTSGGQFIDVGIVQVIPPH
jgi:hypothetical protein